MVGDSGRPDAPIFAGVVKAKKSMNAVKTQRYSTVSPNLFKKEGRRSGRPETYIIQPEYTPEGREKRTGNEWLKKDKRIALVRPLGGSFKSSTYSS